jgi:O-antigen/teichoic acid export membrane protein
MVKFSETNEKEKLKKLFHINSFILSSLATSVALVLFLFTKDFILIWTHDIKIANAVDSVTKMLLLGGIFLSFQFMPYYLAIANGHTKTNVRLGVVSLILIIPALYIFVKEYGLIGATFTWLTLNIVAYFYLGFVLIEKFLKNEFKKWLFYDTIIPFTVTFFIGIISYYVTIDLPKGFYVLIYSFAIGLISLGVNAWVLVTIYPTYKLLDFNVLNKK